MQRRHSTVNMRSMEVELNSECREVHRIDFRGSTVTSKFVNYSVVWNTNAVKAISNVSIIINARKSPIISITRYWYIHINYSCFWKLRSIENLVCFVHWMKVNIILWFTKYRIYIAKFLGRVYIDRTIHLLISDILIYKLYLKKKISQSASQAKPSKRKKKRIPPKSEHPSNKLAHISRFLFKRNDMLSLISIKSLTERHLLPQPLLQLAHAKENHIEMKASLPKA